MAQIYYKAYAKDHDELTSYCAEFLQESGSKLPADDLVQQLLDSAGDTYSGGKETHVRLKLRYFPDTLEIPLDWFDFRDEGTTFFDDDDYRETKRSLPESGYIAASVVRRWIMDQAGGEPDDVVRGFVRRHGKRAAYPVDLVRDSV